MINRSLCAHRYALVLILRKPGFCGSGSVDASLVREDKLLWERTCPRRRYFRRCIFGECTGPFANKSAPT
ncbi:hypothetical protein F4W70_16835 [Pseudomonas cannabina]|nr:hypothetical protein F4W70_16835 [Pseudomonas cannabina]